MYIVRRIPPEQTVALRERVLWPGRSEKCRLPEDDEGIHLGAFPENDPLTSHCAVPQMESATTRCPRATNKKTTIAPVNRGVVISSVAEPVGVISLFFTNCTERFDDVREGTRLCASTRSCQFRKFAVDGHLQGKGIGSLLLQAAEEEALAGGATEFWCDARDHQQGFYSKRGLQVVGEPFAKYEPTKMYVKMRKFIVAATLSNHA